eukprot:2769670-Rhodomonas_salina.1
MAVRRETTRGMVSGVANMERDQCPPCKLSRCWAANKKSSNRTVDSKDCPTWKLANPLALPVLLTPWVWWCCIGIAAPEWMDWPAPVVFRPSDRHTINEHSLRYKRSTALFHTAGRNCQKYQLSPTRNPDNRTKSN